MARLPRIGPAGIPQHVIQRGNNRQICFASDDDLAVYANYLKESAEKHSVLVHAWVFMTNHVHLLVTPKEDGGVSKMMQALGRRYVQYFNFQYKRSGTLWEGRFKSSLVQSEHYLLVCQRYIELNPVRAGMVDDPADYAWSSYPCTALNVSSELFSPHPQYLGLGSTVHERTSNYRSLFRFHVDVPMVKDIGDAVNKGLALGSDHFKQQIEVLCGRRVAAGKMGRPRKKVDESRT